MTRIVVHIERLVLRGVEHADAAALAEGVTHELQHLLMQPGGGQALVGHGDRWRIRAPSVRLPAGSNSLASIQGIARSIHEGISR
jgi:hypothetical protein